MKVGESWAYRAAGRHPLLEVRVDLIGEKKPPRVKITHLDDAREGAIEWVPAARLKVLWADRQALLDEEARWAAVEIDGRPISEERDAMWEVLTLVVPETIADIYHNGAMGLLHVFDVPALAHLAGWSDESIADSAGVFEHEGGLILRWTISRAIAQDIAARHSQQVVAYVREQQAHARERLLERAATRTEWNAVSYEANLAKLAEEPDGLERLTVLLEWCGQAAVDSADNDIAFSRNALRLAELTLEVAPDLRRLRTNKSARRADELTLLAHNILIGEPRTLT